MCVLSDGTETEIPHATPPIKRLCRSCLSRQQMHTSPVIAALGGCLQSCCLCAADLQASSVKFVLPVLTPRMHDAAMGCTAHAKFLASCPGAAA
jgi:hypothetical protein